MGAGYHLDRLLVVGEISVHGEQRVACGDVRQSFGGSMFIVKDFDAAMAAIDARCPALLSWSFRVNGVVWGAAASTAERLHAVTGVSLERIAADLERAARGPHAVFVGGRRVEALRGKP